MTDQSMFDPGTFLDATTTEAAVKRPPLPPGLYVGTIQAVKTDSGTIGKGDRIGQPWLSFIVPIKIEVPAAVKEQFKDYPEQVTLTERPFADLTADHKGLDWGLGKNRGLRIIREATGTNTAGEVFAPRMLEGRQVQVQVVHELYNGETVEKIGGIFKLA